MKEARFSYQRGEGFVTYDTTRTSPGEFIAALARMTDYRAKLRPEPANASGADPAAPGADSAATASTEGEDVSR